MERFECLCQNFGHRSVYTAMKVNTNSYVRSDACSDCFNAFYRIVDFLERINVLQLFRSIHFYGSKSMTYNIFCCDTNVCRTVSPDPRINFYGVARFPTEELMYG